MPEFALNADSRGGSKKTLSAANCRMTSPRIIHYSFCDVNVIAMRIEQEVADVFPWTLTSGPGPKELDWKTVRLRPTTVVLQGLIELPTKILASFDIQFRVPFIFAGNQETTTQRSVPLSLPILESDPTHRIDVGRSSNLVMTENARLKENTNSSLPTVSRINSKEFQYPFQFGSKLSGDQRIASRRVDAKIPARPHRYPDGTSTLATNHRRVDSHCQSSLPSQKLPT